MKRFVRISALVLALLLLTGCSSLSDFETDLNHMFGKEPLVPPGLVDPSAPADNAAATEPTESSPEEATEPATEQPTAPPDDAISAGFGVVYADICLMLDTGDWEQEYRYANIGMIEVIMGQDSKDARYSSITYALEDLNDDGSLEMIVLDAMGNTRILAIYALQNGEPVMTHEGWYRSRLYRLSDGSLYNEGSGGAAYSSFGIGDQLWFTYPKGDDQMEIGYYYAADGTYDPAKAIEITGDEYSAKQTELAKMITPFSTYSFT